MYFLISLIFICVASFLFAKVEIAIEGADGWAEKLPTWKLPKSHWANIFLGHRPMTGYHLWINLFIFFIMHIVYLFQMPSIEIEFRLVALFILFWTVEDFLWFVLNPAFGLKNFKAEKIWWHKDNWWAIAPREYFIFLPIAILLYLLSEMWF